MQKKWILWVQRGLSPAWVTPGGGYLIGRTHQQIATAIQTRFGEDVEQWQVKYQLQKLRLRPEGRVLIVRAKGRPMPAENPSIAQVAAIGRALRRLTAAPASRIVRNLQLATDGEWPGIGARAFRELIAGEKPSGHRLARVDTHPLRRCQLIIHPVLSWAPGQAEGWLWLTVYESDTGFVDGAIYHLIGAAGVRQRGRPIDVPDGEPVEITGSPGAWRVRIPDAVLAGLIDWCQLRLGLPLMRFCLPDSCQGLLTDALREEGGRYEVSFDAGPASELAPALLPGKRDLPALWIHLAQVVDRYNQQIALPQVDARWAAIQSILDDARRPGWKGRDRRRTRRLLDAEVVTFYKTHRPFAGSLADSDLKPRRLRMENPDLA